MIHISEHKGIGRILFWGILYLVSVATGLSVLLLPGTLVIFLLIATSFGVLLLRSELGLMYLLILTALIGRTLLGFDFDTRWSNAGTLFPFYAPFLFVLLFARVIKGFPRTEISVNKSAYVSLTLFFAVWGGLSLIWTENKLHGMLVQFELVLNVFIFLYCLYALRSVRILHNTMWFWVCFTIIVGIFGLVRRYMTFGPYICDYEIIQDVFLRGAVGGTSEAVRRASAIFNPNSFALFLNLSIAVTFGLWAIEKIRFKRWMLLAIILFLVFGLLLTGSKAGVISLMALISYLFLLYKPFRKNILRNSLIAFVLFVMLLGATMQLTPKGENRLADALGKGTKEMMMGKTSFSTRLIIWKAGWRSLVKETAGLGLGPGGYTHHCPPHPHAHSLYFSIIFDFGVLGLFFMLLLGFTYLRNLAIPVFYQETRLQVLSFFLSSGLVVIAVHGIVDHMYSRTILWLFSGFVAAASLRCNNQKTTN